MVAMTEWQGDGVTMAVVAKQRGSRGMTVMT